MSEIKAVRIYHADLPGYRILVDRLWPRGMSKEKAKLDGWAKEVAPSADLRKWYGHDPEKFPEFKEKYLAELDKNPETPAFLALVKKELEKGDVLFLFGAKDLDHNQAIVLKEYANLQLTKDF
ncbi:DUF488 domain-containing protein [Lactobacillus equicursoris]|uniref:DUF488 domain-containing protein n=1 Tax=Lactobacillus equicursoris TaxID=420645 RepID=UPI00242EA736|nr:DUF488 family protein [Lactobacillus equicursoris]MDD6386942.1 DUF488 family protein [Lactobacillus equicursoris]